MQDTRCPQGRKTTWIFRSLQILQIFSSSSCLISSVTDICVDCEVDGVCDSSSSDSESLSDSNSPSKFTIESIKSLNRVIEELVDCSCLRIKINICYKHF